MLQKRVIAVFSVLALMCAAMIVRIGFLSESEYAKAGTTVGTKTMSIGETRGMIYDRNLVPLVNNVKKTVLAVNPTAAALAELRKNLSDDEYSIVSSRAKDSSPFLFDCENYKGKCDDIVKLTSYSRYAEGDTTAVHLLGYTNSDGNGVTGIEKAYDDILTGASGSLKVRFSVDVGGHSLAGEKIQVINDNYCSKAGVVLTIDSDIQKYCEDAMRECGIVKGAVVVLDADDASIAAMASAPTYDRDNIADYLKSDSSPFMSRAVNAYSVGSVYKAVVACAALQKGISETTLFDCLGYVDVGSNRFNCHKQDGHGVLNMSDAMAVSCNSYYISLGLETGGEEILSLSSMMGLGQSITLAKGIVSQPGCLPTSDEIDSKSALANLSFGQGTLLATPLQIAAVYCTLANRGYYREPFLVEKIVDSNMNSTAYYLNETGKQVIDEEICDKVCSMLEKTVTTGSGKLAKPDSTTAAGKTATAQSGWYENGDETVHTWFAGYYPAEHPKYVIVVFKEDGCTSSTDCAPVFKKIAEEIEKSE